ncbi:MAG: hypothetical protein GF341_02685 [candidate division Zixibacteria bacterium]|nr:hypothetical protein [candidate division Zixibacteria bacterium]
MNDPHNQHRFHRLVRYWLILLGLWAVPGVIFAGLSHVAMLRAGRDSVIWEWLGGSLAAWWTWALLTPLIVWLARRYPVDQTPRMRNIGVHAMAGIVLGFIQLCIAVLASIRFHGEPATWAYYLDQVVPYLMWRGLWAVLVYWAVLGVVYALDYRWNLHKRALEISHLEAQVAHARLDALQRQLQPHFLFNALNSISVLIRAQRTDDADRVLGDLSDLLRYVLAHQDAHEVALRDELAFTKRYTDIERTRYGERLCVTFNASAGVMNARVPGFILQLLVENAIRHGIGRRNGGGHVTVNVTTENNRLMLTVNDNGAGLSESGRTDTHEGIGLQNAHERLQHLYGDAYRLDLSENADGGVTTTLVIPLATTEQMSP